jgi:hypothetical protein
MGASRFTFTRYALRPTISCVFRKKKDAGGGLPQIVYRIVGSFSGRTRQQSCLRCLCLSSREDFLALVPERDREARVSELFCLGCGQNHRAVSAEAALHGELIGRDDYEFLAAPLAVRRGPISPEEIGTETVRVKNR